MKGLMQAMKTDIESSINEAEVCRSMGLFSDSLSIYEKILGSVSPQDTQTHDKIEKRIRLLKQEIDSQDESGPKGVSAKEITMLRKRLSDQGDIPAILDSASAFKEMGLHQEAIPEFVKLLKEDYPAGQVIPELTESLLKLHSPSKATEEFNKLITDQKLGQKDVAHIRFLFGQEMEKRDHREVALDNYKAAHSLNPDDAEIKKRMDSIAATFTTGSKYDYLLREKMVTTDKLQEAFALSKKMNKSVEHVLIEHNKISKKAIGKSFSLFYDTTERILGSDELG
jgi:tetratricopeptide (TPR) repeat protein